MSASFDDPGLLTRRPALAPAAALGPAPTPRWLLALGRQARPTLHAAAHRLAVVVAGLVLPALLWLLWQRAAERHWVPEQLLPAPALVWQTLLELWDSGELRSHLAFSASRVGWSLLIGGSAGLLLGFAMGLSRTLRAYLHPSFNVIAQFPVLGWVPLLIIFVGIDEALKIAAISIAVMVPVAINALNGIANIARPLWEVASVYRFTRAQLLWRLVLPAAAPSLFTGWRQAVMQAWLSLVFVELLASSEGIGYLIVWGRQLSQPDLVVAGMCVIGAVGVLLDLGLRWLESCLRGWHRGAF